VLRPADVADGVSLDICPVEEFPERRHVQLLQAAGGTGKTLATPTGTVTRANINRPDINVASK
jgi:hypothetical protein